MVMPLTAQAMQRLAAMLMQPPQAQQPKPPSLPGLGSQLRTAMPQGGSGFGGPEPSPGTAMPPPAPMAGAAAPEGMVNQALPPPPINPPLNAPPPVSSASFSPMGATGAPPAGPALPPGTSPMGATPDMSAMPGPVGTDPSMADPSIRQAIMNAMKAKGMLPAPWAQNFGNLADQAG